MGRNKIDLIGKRFSRLLVVDLNKVQRKKGGTDIYWKCKCDCGKVVIVRSDNLRRGHTKSCGCLLGEYNMKYKNAIEAGLQRVFNAYKYAAVNRNLDFCLTYEQFSELICSPCYYCGGLPNNEIKARRRASKHAIVNGIDRKDNSIGYILDNCVPCCASCNRLKGTLSEDKFKSNIQRIYKHFCIDKVDDIEG